MLGWLALFLQGAWKWLLLLFGAANLSFCGMTVQPGEQSAEQAETAEQEYAAEKDRFEKDGEVVYTAATPEEHRRQDGTSSCWYADNELIVQLSENLTEEEARKLAEDNGAELAGFISVTGTCQWRLPDSYDFDGLKACAGELESREEIAAAYVNCFYEEDGNSVPSSESSKWKKEKYNWGYLSVHADKVWDYVDDMKDPVNIGIMDAGFQDHPDLDYVIERKGNPPKKSNSQHGTHVSGIAAAVCNNGEGIAGVYPDPTGEGRVYAAAAYEDSGNAVSGVQQMDDVARMILNGAKVINISLSSGSNSEIYARCVTYQEGKWNRNFAEGYKDYVESSKIWESFLGKLIDGRYEFLLVFSAGNASYHKKGDGDGVRYCYTGTQDDLITFEEAGALSGFTKHLYYGVVEPEFNNPILFIEDERVKERVVCVGAYGNSGEITKFSNMGDRVDILAPGLEIYSTADNDLMSMNGTSQAAPYVTGAAACIWSLDKDLAASEVRSLLLDGELSKIRDADIDLEKPALNLEISMRKAKEYVDRKHGKTEETEKEEGMPVKITASVQSTDGMSYVLLKDATATIQDENGNILYDSEELWETEANFYLPEGSYTVTVEAEGCIPVTAEHLRAGTDYQDGEPSSSLFRGDGICRWAFTLEPDLSDSNYVNPLWWKQEDYTGKFTDYLKNTLLPEYGVMPTAEKSLQIDGGSGVGGMETVWLNRSELDGMLAYKIADFDGDKAVEMFLIRAEGGELADQGTKSADEKWDRNRDVQIYMEMYEYRDGTITVADYRDLVPAGWYRILSDELQTGFFTLEHDGKIYLAMDSFYRLNDSTTTLSLYRYDGSDFQYEKGFCLYRHYNAESFYTADEEPAAPNFVPFHSDIRSDGWTLAKNYHSESETADEAKVREVDNAYADALAAYGLKSNDLRLDADSSFNENWNMTTSEVYSGDGGNPKQVASVSVCPDFREWSGKNSRSWHLFRKDPSGSLDAYRGQNGESAEEETQAQSLAAADGAVAFHGHSYAKYETDLTWKEAEAHCESLGGHLVTVTSEEENQFVISLLSDHKYKGYWLGAYRTAADSWAWVTGEAFDYQNWHTNEPNAGNRELYLQLLLGDSWKWDDTWNDGDHAAGVKTHGFICEWDE